MKKIISAFMAIAIAVGGFSFVSGRQSEIPDAGRTAAQAVSGQEAPELSRVQAASGQEASELSGAQAVSGQEIPEPAISAVSAIVIEESTGKVLYEKNADEKKYPASTTKIMTALLALETQTDLDRMIKIPPEAAGVEGSSIYLKAGEEISMKDLLYGMMLRSGNDAAMAVAYAVGGTAEEFVAMMNQRAKELGCENTHFMNPNGLQQEQHYTTARELAAISRAAMQNEAFRYIVGSQSWVAAREEGDFTHFFNKNKVIYQYDGGTGIKTGYTTAAGRCLAASSERDGMRLVCIVLQAPDWFQDVYALMDYAYESYEPEKLINGGQALLMAKVDGGDKEYTMVVSQADICIPKRKGEKSKASVVYELDEGITAPLRRGERCGQLKVYWDGVYLSHTPLYIAEDVDKRPHFFSRLMQKLGRV